MPEGRPLQDICKAAETIVYSSQQPADRSDAQVAELSFLWPTPSSGASMRCFMRFAFSGHLLLPGGRKDDKSVEINPNPKLDYLNFEYRIRQFQPKGNHYLQHSTVLRWSSKS